MRRLIAGTGLSCPRPASNGTTPAAPGRSPTSVDRLFAPLGDHLLVPQPDAKPEQLAHVGGRGGAVAESASSGCARSARSGRGGVPAAPSGRRAAARCRRFERVKPDQQIVLDRGRASRAGRPNAGTRLCPRTSACRPACWACRTARPRGPGYGRVAQLGELAIDLLMVGLPEKADRGIERLGELIARHRTFGQAGEDGVSEGQGSIVLPIIEDPKSTRLTLCVLLHMRQYAYEDQTALPPRPACRRPQEASFDHDRSRQDGTAS